MHKKHNGSQNNTIVYCSIVATMSFILGWRDIGAILKFINPRSASAQTPNLKLCALLHNQYKIPKPQTLNNNMQLFTAAHLLQHHA